MPSSRSSMGYDTTEVGGVHHQANDGNCAVVLQHCETHASCPVERTRRSQV
jgi:hypothetical protein